jgi:hypothetical protein
MGIFFIEIKTWGDINQKLKMVKSKYESVDRS